MAVKRILSNYADIAEKEVRTLQESDYHQNVIRYYCRQQSGAFLFIALELCPGSLHDFIFAKDKFSPEMLAHSNPRDTLLQIMHGLHHLHELKIVHRDIKPQNILVGEPKGKDKRPRFLISDFGLCRKLQQDEYSFGATTAQQAGTVGWRARELLTDAVTGLASGISPSSGNHNNQENTEASSSSASGTDMVVDPLTKRRATRAIDIFAMGCVCYFVLSGGHHPFGERFTRELNIVNQAFNLSHLDDTFPDASGHEAKKLISAMISGDPKKRPDTAKVGAHPFFWKTEKRLDFLCAVSDRFELEEQREKADRTAKKPNPYVSPFIAILETRAREVLGEEGWMKRLDRHLVHELGLNKRRGYDEKKVLHLLRMIRNKVSDPLRAIYMSVICFGPITDILSFV